MIVRSNFLANNQNYHMQMKFLLLALLVVVFGPSQVTAEELSFKSEILPIFEQQCLMCHGAEPFQGELDLRSVASLLKGGKSGSAVTPNKAEHSLLIEKIVHKAMPPFPPGLSDPQIETIRNWINTGLAHEQAVSETLVTEKDVLPIFQLRCAKCHGKRQQKGDLDARNLKTLLQGGNSGPALVPGSSDKSLLFARVTKGEMPPPDMLYESQIRPPTESEVAVLKKWIDQGALPDPPKKESDSKISTKLAGTDLWSFQSPVRHTPPSVGDRSKVRNSIDAFVLHELESKGLTFAPDASDRQLLRRVFLDLTGMPPTREETLAFLNDDAPNAYERLIDQLLASPRYGERWAQIWLDLAGYADSEGVIEEDRLRLHAWRYRDYVIRAFNADKPYDRFLHEQIAGDELFDYKNTQPVTQEVVDTLAATGFLRLTPDGTYGSATGSIDEIMTVIADELHVLSSAVMGLTVGCARCHDHKYDPIPQKDYYRLGAIFQTALDPYDWVPPTKRFVAIGLETEHLEAATFNKPIDAEIRRLRKSFEAIVNPRWESKLEAQLEKVPIAVKDDLRTIAHILMKDRRGAIVDYSGLDEAQLRLAKKFKDIIRIPHSNGEWHQIAEAFPEIKESAGKINKELTKLRASRWPEPKIRALYDMGGQPSPVYLLRRGDAKALGERVYPDVPQLFKTTLEPLQVYSPRPDETSGNRLAFARWLTQPGHPLTSRVMVNRIWLNHFGHGLVMTPANFGHTGATPSHPELLDWLSTEFVRNKWSLKSLHRLIMTSSVYRQSSRISAQAKRLDPKNTLLSRMNLRRMNAEMLHDSVLSVTERLDPTSFGRPVTVTKKKTGEIVPDGSSNGWRRAIYTLKKRRDPVTMLEIFDAPQLSPNCTERTDSTVAPQALHLMNGSALLQHARFLAGRLVEQHPNDVPGQVQSAYEQVLTRAATAQEVDQAKVDLAELTTHWKTHLTTVKYDGPRPVAARWMAMGSFVHALLNSPEFIYID